MALSAGTRIDADVLNDALAAVSGSEESSEPEGSWDGFVVGIIMLLALLAVAALMFPSIFVYN